MASLISIADAPGVQAGSIERVTLIPAPVKVTMAPGRCALDSNWSLHVAVDDSSHIALDLLRHEARRTHGVGLPTNPVARRRMLVLKHCEPFTGIAPALAAQGYRLTVCADSITVSAPQAAGLYYGVQTLRQLLRQFTHRSLPSLTVIDYPALRWRGVSDDISRGQCSTPEDLVTTIEKLGYYKLNMYCLYLEDMLRYWSAPEVGVGRGALTPSAIPRLQALARKHHVTLVPIYQSLAHQESFLSYPRFASIAERPPYSPWSLKTSAALHKLLPALAIWLRLPSPGETVAPSTTVAASSTEALSAIRSLLGEFLSGRNYELVGLGGDEPLELGTGMSRRAVAQHGFGTIYARYMTALAKTVEQGGSTALLYGDVLLRDSLAMAQIPRSVGVIDWNYDPMLPSSLGRLREMGFSTVLASPGLWNWNALYPDLSRSIPNIAREAAAAVQFGADGLIVASWCDGGAESLRSLNWPGYVYCADATWKAPRAWRDLVDAFVLLEYGTAHAGLKRALAKLGWQDFGSYVNGQRLLRRPPVVKLRTKSALERMTALEQEASAIRADLPRTMFSGATADAIMDLDYVAGAYQYAARRELVLHSIAVADSHPRSKARTAQTSMALAELRDSCLALARYHRTRWLRHNKVNGLALIEQRYRRQAGALDSLATVAAR